MGGGGSNSSPPVDTAPGGGTYPVNAFGTAYNPDWYSGGGGIGGAVGKGLQTFGSAVAEGSKAPPWTNYQANLQPFILPASDKESGLIPTTSGGGGNELMKILQALLGGG